jgi:hypothetical protein
MTGYAGRTPLDPSEARVLKKPFTIAELAAKVEEALFSNDSAQRRDNVIALKPSSRS